MHLDVVTFIYKLLNLNLQDAFHLWTCLHLCVNWSVFVCGSLRLSWRGWIHECIFFNKELSVGNQMPLSFSANHMTAVPTSEEYEPEPLRLRFVIWYRLADSITYFNLKAYPFWKQSNTLHFEFTQGWIKSTCFSKCWSSIRLWSSNFIHCAAAELTGIFSDIMRQGPVSWKHR